MESSADTERDLFPAPRSDAYRDQGSFRTRFNFPGRNRPAHDDHGYGPLSTVVESFMDPGTLIPMHQHRNEEIVSWVPAGVMRHDDREDNALVTDADHLLVMNAGRGFWHAEETLADDPPLRMLQIFVRPHSLDLDPGIQHGPLPDPTPNEWRRVFAPAGSDHPFTVRNAVDCFDVRLDAGASVTLPAIDGRHAYVYVFDGAVEIGGVTLDATESLLWTPDGSSPTPAGPSTAASESESAVEPPTVTAERDATLVAFLVDPDAPITRQGTIGR
ncbi:pirin family protein [Halorubrum sp. CBA1125]|uniref:pirin family protein n=1 Tax=Halorubrum sp. CBA1125 TaxID=2668072 RepID=UPI0012E964A7|nr:pirin family protein [Halorubrum sp. CBA1125]MUW15690.1 pirin family protein [Halorubrum sp. CBA1125]